MVRLPTPPTSFIGRERELPEVVGLLERDDLRLLTLTGPGGTGKTRLALQAAKQSAPAFPDGVYWVPLAPLRDPAFALSAIAQTLELQEQPQTPLQETLREALAGRRLLLCLDNAEQLLPGLADQVAALREVDGPTFLCTSRERLDLQAERLYPVPGAQGGRRSQALLWTAPPTSTQSTTPLTLRSVPSARASISSRWRSSWPPRDPISTGRQSFYPAL